MDFLSKFPIAGLDIRKSFPSDDLALSDLIKEDVADSMSFYYAKVAGGEILLDTFLEFEDVLGERERRRICLERISATGISPGEYGRYYSENF